MPDTPSPSLTPALSSEQWNNVVVHQGMATLPINFGYPCRDGIHQLPTDPELARERHKMAALCLYQQAFGFTAEDVSLLREIAEAFPMRNEAEADELGGKLHDLTRRIAQLLPPAPPQP